MVAIPISRAVRELAGRAPDTPIIIDGDTVVTRDVFHRTTNRLARAFAAMGVGPGDYVSIILPNGLQFLESVVAAWKLGAVPQPLPAKLAQTERDEILALVNPKLIVGLLPGKSGHTSHIAEGYAPSETISDENLPDVTAPSFKAMASGGSTGRPKIIVAGFPGVVDLDAPFPTVRASERMLVTGPLYHNAPFLAVTTCILAGGSAVLMPSFDAEETLRQIERHRVNFITLVPTMMHRIWRLDPAVRDKYDLSSLRIMMHSAAPCPVWLKAAWIGWLGPDRVLEAYGSTEAPGYTMISGREWLDKRGSVGRPDRGVCDLAVFDAEGNEVPAGVIGEICMRPAAKPGADYAHFFPARYAYIGAVPRRINGTWDSMGDLGYVDEDGYLFLADRRTDVIVRGGAKIYPAEVEAAIDAHPSVRSSVVIGMPDEDLGEKVVAFVDPTGPISSVELRIHLRHHLTPHKIPAVFEFVSAPLRDDAGKVRRSEIRRNRIAKRDAETADIVLAAAE